MKRDKYSLYETAVQTPEAHAISFALMYAEIRGKKARKLREDFCGTFAISCEWVKEDPSHRAISLDLDPEPLAYGKRKYYSKLTAAQKKRLKPMLKNVMSVTSPKSDIIAACNFSFWIFKQRKELIKYFTFVRKSLDKDGVFILETAGGPGMIEKTKDRKTYHTNKTGKYQYIWHQKKFDPITHDGQYAIHFKFPNGSMMKDAFTYDWRVWTLPELRDALLDAGFSKVHVYWETSKKGNPTGHFTRTQQGDNSYAWVAYVLAEK